MLRPFKAITFSVSEGSEDNRRLSIASARSTLTTASSLEGCAFRVLIYWGEERQRQRVKK